jgi:hypothetical protein
MTRGCHTNQLHLGQRHRILHGHQDYNSFPCHPIFTRQKPRAMVQSMLSINDRQAPLWYPRRIRNNAFQLQSSGRTFQLQTSFRHHRANIYKWHCTLQELKKFICPSDWKGCCELMIICLLEKSTVRTDNNFMSLS